MSQDKNELIALINSNLPDNDAKEITPLKHREVVTQIVDSCLNTEETSQQTVAGLVEFTQAPTVGGDSLITDAPSNNDFYHRRNGQWSRHASFLATTEVTIPINTDSVTPSSLPIGTLYNPVGISLFDAATGAVRNITGRTVKTMAGTVSFNPSVSSGNPKRVVLISETSADEGASWQGNLSSIRKVEIGSSSESFKTALSFIIDWPNNSLLRFRAYDETGAGLSFVTESETILGQAFTGVAMAWDLSER